MRQKALSLLLSLVLILTALPGSAFAAETGEPEVLETWSCGGGNAAPNANVTAVLETGGTLTIQGSGPMYDFAANGMSMPWFTSWRKISRVVVQEGVTTVCPRAFYVNYPGITSVEIAGSVRSIGDESFLCRAGDSSCLTEVVIKSGAGGREIGYRAFAAQSSMTRAVVGEGISVIGEGAFTGCFELSDISLPNTLTSIDKFAFVNCNALSELHLPESLESVGDGVFQNCKALKEIILPSHVTSLGKDVFYNSAVTRVAVPEGLTVPDGTIPSGAEVKTYTGGTPKDFASIPSGGEDLTDILASGTCDTGLTWTLYKTGLLQIQGSGAMRDYSSYTDYPFFPYAAEVTSLTISDGVTRIGNGAFRGFSQLKAVRMADSVTEIGNTAFLGCSGLTQAELSSNIRRIETSTFKDCSALTEIEIPEGVTYFGDWAFWNTGLTHVTIAQAAVYQEGSHPSFPASCTVERSGGSIVVPPDDGKVVKSGTCAKSGSSPSYQLYDTRRLVISGTGEMADYSLSNRAPWLQWSGVYPYPTVLVESGVESVGAYSFYASAENQYVTTVQLADSVSKIGNSAFAGNEGLKQITMAGVKEIGNSAFASCSGLTGVEIPSGLTTIGRYAFSKSGLQGTLTFPETLTSIGAEAFAETGLTQVDVYYRTEVPADAFPSGCTVKRYGAPALTPGDPLPVSSRTAPIGSDNIHDNSYLAWSEVVFSYLASGSQGGFRRVDCYSWRDPDSGTTQDALVMEEYDRDGTFLRSWDIPWELPYFGGFYEGSDGYYFVFANSNSQTSDAVETVRVVKYTKDLEPLGKASLMGGNVAAPFYMGSLRMDEGNGTLYVYMGRQMYDGHQSSLVLAVDTSTMQLLYQGTDMFHPFYVSHSMNQFIKYDPAANQVAAASQGDTYPRALTLMRSSAALGSGTGETRFLVPGGSSGNNHTLTNLGGLEAAENHYLTAWSSIDQSVFDITRTYNVFLSVISKTDEKSFRNIAVTNYPEGGPVSAGSPVLVKMSENRFAILWEEQKRKETVSSTSPAYSMTDTTGEVCFAYYDGTGNKLSGVHRMEGALSDCQPIVIDGSILWYVTEEGKAPVFYRITGESGTVLKRYDNALTPSAPLEATRTAPLKTGNLHSQNYNGRYNRPSRSHPCPGFDGGFYRVEYDADNGLVMEEYDRNGAFLQGWDIPMELPLFGGFYGGSSGFYFVFGQNNPSDSSSLEVLRVVKYTKNLERLGAASVFGGNTYAPFDASGCRMDEGNGLLYIHTGHEMFKSSDGKHHQACMTFSVDTEVMEFQYQFYGVSNPSANGYVSHSFNQFIRVDGSQVVRLDHGDAYPRGVGLFVNNASLSGSPAYAVLFPFSGNTGENQTGAGVGGLEVSPSAYLSAISSVDQNSGKRNNNKTYNVYLLVTDKSTGKTTRVQLTNYSEGGAYSASTPHLVKLSDDRFLLLWEEQPRSDSFGNYYYSDYTGQVKYAIFDGAGNQQGAIRSVAGALSDCQPAVVDGKAAWYTTERTYSAADGGYVPSAPTFYQIDSAGNCRSFQATIGKKPEGVRLPESILAKLGSCKTVLAASYSTQGRMTGIVQGTLRGNLAVFSRRLSQGWTLYFLDGKGAPLCSPYKIP